MPHPSPPSPWRLHLASGLILGLTLWLRVTHAQRLPIFGDEGINLYWAQAFAQGDSDAYPLLMDGRYLFGVLMAGAGVYGPGPLALGRLMVAVWAVLGGAAAMGLGRQIGTRQTGLLAGLLYALLPYAVFHERQALTDPLMANAGALAALFTARAARAGGVRWAALAAAGLAAAFLFKPSGLIYGLAPGLTVAFWPAAGRGRALRQGALILALAVAFTLAFLLALADRLGVNDNRLATQSLGFIQCPPIACQLDAAEQWRQLQATLPPLPEVLAVYFGWPLLGLAALAGPLSPPHTRRRALWLAAFVAGALAFFLLAGRQTLVPRYLSPLAAPLAALGAQGTLALLRRLPTRGGRLALGAPLVLALALPLANTAPLIMRPELARLPAFDRYQYFTGPVAGAAFQQAALEIAAHDPAPLIITRHFMRYALAAFFDPRQARVANPWELSWEAVEARLAQGGALYLVDEVAGTAPGVYAYQAGLRGIRVRPITTADAQTRAQVFAFLFPAPEEFRADFEALAAALPGPRAVVVYPPHPLPDGLALTALTAGGPAPWTLASMTAALAQAVGDQDVLEVVYLQEARLDPGREVEAWLSAHYFRLAEQWVGALRRVTYANGAAEVAEALPVDARFGEALVLRRVEMLDAQPRPGGVVRLRLVWQATAPVDRPYKVFAHLFNDTGLLAQHDGQPVAELRPTDTFQAGEVVVDQFAIQLPAEAAPGEYQLRIGLYDRDTQVRLPARLADGAEAEFWTGGQVSVP